MALSLCYFPVLQALLWAPSPRFWFLCSSFALGGLASKGLRLPSLKSDVHSTCWFFKQLCPQKKIRTSRSPSVLGGIGGREGGWAGYGARAIRLCFSVSLFLFLSLLHYLPISVFSQVFFFLSFFQFSRHLLNRAQTWRSLWVSHTLCMTCGGEGARSKHSES